MTKSTTPAVVAIIGITILTAIALFQKIDGVILSTSIAAIAGLGGFIAGKVAEKSSKRGD